MMLIMKIIITMMMIMKSVATKDDVNVVVTNINLSINVIIRTIMIILVRMILNGRIDLK